MTELNFTEAEVCFYLEAVLGKKPVRDEKGNYLLTCPFAAHRTLFVYMQPSTGDFYCRAGCAGGELAVFEMGRSKIFDLREARRAVLKIIGAEKEKARLADQAARDRALLAAQEAKAAREKALEGLPDDVKKLLRMVDRHPGKSRRWLQQYSHLYAHQLHKAIRFIERRKLVAWKDERVSGGRRRRLYFPLDVSQPPTTMTTDDEASC